MLCFWAWSVHSHFFQESLFLFINSWKYLQKEIFADICQRWYSFPDREQFWEAFEIRALKAVVLFFFFFGTTSVAQKQKNERINVNELIYLPYLPVFLRWRGELADLWAVTHILEPITKNLFGQEFGVNHMKHFLWSTIEEHTSRQDRTSRLSLVQLHTCSKQSISISPKTERPIEMLNGCGSWQLAKVNTNSALVFPHR